LPANCLGLAVGAEVGATGAGVAMVRVRVRVMALTSGAGRKLASPKAGHFTC
jgi:hypothetical protein